MARRSIRRARARSIPVFHVDIRLYAIGSTDSYRRTYVAHEKVIEITTRGLEAGRHDNITCTNAYTRRMQGIVGLA